MGFAAWGHDSEHYKASEEVKKSKVPLSHELIAAAASYEAAKAYQEHCKKHGKPASHEKAKAVFAGLAGIAVTHIVEKKLINASDRGKVEKAALDHATEHLRH